MSGKSEFNSLSHFAINVNDCDRAISFYNNVFGWQFSAWGPPGFFMSQVGDLKASIQQRQEDPFPTHIGNFECTISVQDIDQVCALIVENGGKITMPKVTIPNVAEVARVEDCEGNTFSVAKYLPRAHGTT